MPIMKLPDTEIRKIDEADELFMCVHAAEVTHNGKTFIVPVMSGVVLVPDNQLVTELQNYLSEPWLQRTAVLSTSQSQFAQWFAALPVIPGTLLPSNTATRVALSFWTVSPRFPLPSPPPPPPVIYGHLPFQTTSPSNAILYRWEPFPTSRRIVQSTNIITKGTYASPESELKYIETGFGAVGRNALPSLLPACFRWKLEPRPVTLHCGAGVPLYGQSGGGVETFFSQSIKSRGPIVNPVIISPL